MGEKKTQTAAADGGQDTAQTKAPMIVDMKEDVILKRLEEIKRAVEEGRMVRISGIRVRKIEYQVTRRGGIIVIVNDGELIDYAKRILTRRIEVE
jgi:hypothetical protein